VRNILGVPGAIVADLLTQLFGLAALAFILPIAFGAGASSPTGRCSASVCACCSGCWACCSPPARRRAAAQQRLPLHRWARRRDRRLDAAAADGAFRRNARRAGAHRGRGRVRRGNAAVLSVAAGFGCAPKATMRRVRSKRMSARMVPLGWITHGFLSLKARARAGADAPPFGARTRCVGDAAAMPGSNRGSMRAPVPRCSRRSRRRRTERTRRARKPRATESNAARATKIGRAAAMCCPRSNCWLREAIGRAVLSADALQTTRPRSKASSPTSACRGEIINAPAGPGRHALRARAGAGHQILARDRPRRRYRPLT